MSIRVQAATAVVVALGGLIQPAAARAAEPTRILIVGDSVTNGSVGDWTWRYRLWNNLTESGTDVDFVGPNTGVLDPELDTVNAMEYADPDFDVDHAARWGMSYSFPDHPIGDLVSEYNADVVVVDLGLNDLTWLGLSAETVADDARRWVSEVRSVNPAASVVLTQLPQDWIVKTPEFNALLDDLAAELDTPEARVVVAEAPGSFVLDTDTYDLAHPSATGEVKIAQSVAEALAEIGVGSAPEAFPQVVNGPAVPPVLSTTQTRFGVSRLSWTMPLGATGVEVWRRPVGREWVEVSGRSALAVRPGVRTEFKVRAFKGSAVSPYFSNVVTVVRGAR